MSLSDKIAAELKEHASGNTSAFVEQAVRGALLRASLASHRVPDWDDDFAEMAMDAFENGGEAAA